MRNALGGIVVGGCSTCDNVGGGNGGRPALSNCIRRADELIVLAGSVDDADDDDVAAAVVDDLVAFAWLDAVDVVILLPLIVLRLLVAMLLLF